MGTREHGVRRPLVAGVFGIAVALAGCFQGREVDCTITCTRSCPGDMTCDGTFCRAPGATGSCASSVDPDADVEPACAVAPRSVAAGDGFSCLVDSDGRVLCWGANDRFQLGHDDSPREFSPAPVPGLPADETFVEVAAGDRHACARTERGEVYCWGDNDSGQVGETGASVEASAPVQVTVGRTDALALGERHSCALLVEGDIRCWGRDVEGQLGGDSPLSLVSLPDVRTLAAGRSHTCALTAIGDVYCWGLNEAGQAGQDPDDTPQVDEPTRVDLEGQEFLTAGFDNTCASDGSAQVWCWGESDGRVLGLADHEDTHIPVSIGTSDAVTGIAVGSHTACALRGDLDPVCWGDNTLGQLTGTPGIELDQAIVVPVGGLSAVAAGPRHFCGIDRTEVVCWGLNERGQRALPPPLEPVPVRVDGSYTEVAAGDRYTCAANDGATRCWGLNQNAALGPIDDLSVVESSSPRDLTGNFNDLSAGYRTTCALGGAGGSTMVCWGRGGVGTLGNGSTVDASAEPVLVTSAENLIGRVATVGHDQAFSVGANLLAWGANHHGQAGLGGAVSKQLNPVAVDLGVDESVKSVDGSSAHGCAVTTSGGLYCWGKDWQGQLGTGEPIEHSAIPVAVSTTEAFATVATGSRHTCAINDAGAMFCWGEGSGGQTAHGSSNDVPIPMAVDALAEADFESVQAGDRHTCALSNEKQLLCWGSDLYGQTGQSSGLEHRPPKAVSLPASVLDFSVGATHTCAVLVDNRLYCWGDDTHGEIGVGRDLDRSANRFGLCAE